WGRAGRAALAEAAYRAALDLYRGPFLAEDLYAEWAAEPRETYRRLYLETLLALGRMLFQRHDRGALTLAERLAAEDPFSDTAIRALMVAHATFGDPAAALDAFHLFRRRLRAELGALPAPETDALHTAL